MGRAHAPIESAKSETTSGAQRIETESARRRASARARTAILRAVPASTFLRLVLGLVCTGTAGCTLVTTYPAPAAEACDGRGEDEDLDGAVDCDDLDCRGSPSCAEEDLAHCTNGFDDDGDLRADFEDPGCWPEGIASVERCASILGGSQASSLWDTNVTYVPDPTGVRPDVARLDTSPTARAGTGTPGVRLRGGLEGLEATLEIYLPTDLGREVAVELLDASPTRSAPTQLAVLLRPRSDGTVDGLLRTVVDGRFHTSASAARFASVGEWSTLDLAISGGTLTASAGGPTASLALPDTFDPAGPLTFVVLASDPILLGSATLTRGPLVRCDETTSDPASGEVPLLGIERTPDGLDTSHTALAGALEAESGVCALVFEGPADGSPSLVSALGAADGTWGMPGSVLDGSFGPGMPPSVDGLAGWGGAVVTRDLDGRIVAAVVQPDATHWDLLLLAGGDLATCTGLAAVGTLGLPAVAGRVVAPLPPVAYEVDARGHAITVLTLPEPVPSDQRGLGIADLRTLRSATGTPGTFVEDGEPDRVLLDALEPPDDLGAHFDAPRVRRLGRDRIATVRRWDGRIELWVERSRGWSRVSGVELGASHEDAAFDADTVGYADLVESTRSPHAWHGRLFYTGYYGDGTPHQATGFGLARLVVRAPGSSP